MPGSVANASATVVLPGFLASGFRRLVLREAARNQYLDGRASVAVRTGAERLSWQLDYSLAPDDLETLRTFWETNRHKAMIFYDWQERIEEGLTPVYDETGVAGGAGKYVVRFGDQDWAQSNELMRGSVALELVEIA